MQKRILSTILAATMLAMAANAVQAKPPKEKGPKDVLSIAVFGDSPYGLNNGDTAQFAVTPLFIRTINDDPDVSLVLNVGDIHSGKQVCTLAYDQSIYNMWTAFQSPLVYTPGDNEWTDCHKSGESGGANGGEPNPITNLSYVRSTFFSIPGHTIGVDKPVWSQAVYYDSVNYPTDGQYVENVIWEQSDVVFVTLNVPGGSNNDEDNWLGQARTQAQTDEILQRTGADLRWLDQAFTLAKDEHAKAVVIQIQADMWDLDGKPPSHVANYKPFIDRIAARAAAFGQPVLLFNGDSHVYRSDNPLVAGAPCLTESTVPGTPDVACANDAYASQPGGYNVANFHRIVVHGSTFPLEWLKLQVDPRANAPAAGNAFGPFTWTRMIQP